MPKSLIIPSNLSLIFSIAVSSLSLFAVSSAFPKKSSCSASLAECRFIARTVTVRLYEVGVFSINLPCKF